MCNATPYTYGGAEPDDAMTQGQINTEADALRDILSWLKDRPAWQRDALRRLIAQGELTDKDIDELTALCKDDTLASQPLAEGDINAQQSGAPTVALKSIRGVQNVNALAEGQTLTFIPKGVTIIYGDNGAGKSGYVRILKRACRARTVRGKRKHCCRTSMVGNPAPSALNWNIVQARKSRKPSGKTASQRTPCYPRSAFSTHARQTCMSRKPTISPTRRTQ